jgi:dimethylglycine dehydrogenase
VPGCKNYWSACAVMAGFSQGGGVGLTLAEWMVEGEPSRDVFAMDVARYGSYTNEAWTRTKVTENYQKRFSIAYPNEELPAGRPYRTTPAYGLWKARRAVFGSAYGMEHVNYFAPEGEPLIESTSFRRSNAFDAVGAECRAVRTNVGINEIHNFGKYEVTGSEAENWLNHVFANRMPAEGRIILSPLLNNSGKLVGDFTIARLAAERFQLTASYGSQGYHLRWFRDHLPDALAEAGGVKIENVSDTRLGFQIAGPKAQELLARVTRSDVSTASFAFLGVRQIEVGTVPAIVGRISYTGDKGYEIYVAAEHQAALYHTLMEAGEDLGLTPFGMRAMMSLRLEKSFGSWLREYRPDYTAAETGLDRFISWKKNDFIGRDAAVAEKETPPARLLATFVVDADDADVWGDESIFLGDEVIGFVTSGGYAHYSEKSVALGLIPRELVVDGSEFEIEILGDKRPAKLITEALFDPTGEKARG